MKRRGFVAALVGALAAPKLLGKKVVVENPEGAKRIAQLLVREFPPQKANSASYPRTMTMTL